MDFLPISFLSCSPIPTRCEMKNFTRPHVPCPPWEHEAKRLDGTSGTMGPNILLPLCCQWQMFYHKKKVPNRDWRALKHWLLLSWVILVGIAPNNNYNTDTISRSIVNIELWRQLAILVKRSDARTRLPRFRFHLCHHLDTCHSLSYLFIY